MPPRNFSSGSGNGESSFFDSLLSTSIDSLCSAETRPRVASPSYPMCGDVVTDCANNDTTNESGQSASSSAPVSNTQTLTTATPTPMRPPLPKGSTRQQWRKLPGLSVSIPESPADVHTAPPSCPVSLRKNVELKKNLSERHFLFRPVSEDDQSKASSTFTKASTVNRASF